MKKKPAIFLAVIILAALAVLYAVSIEEDHPVLPLMENSGEEKKDDEQIINDEEGVDEGEKAKESPRSDESELSSNELAFEYPDAVRGIYVTAHSAGGRRINELIDYVNATELNAMVIDVKDDWGNITFKVDEEPLEKYSKNYISDLEGLLERLSENNIYPIARIVVFKDTVLAKEHPELSFLEEGEVWTNRRGEAFVNPFIKDIWDYNIAVAEKAVEAGFQEIQFDYVRFPEGFENRDEILSYSKEDYAEEKLLPRLKREWDNIPVYRRPEEPQYSQETARVTAVTDFVEYAYERLSPLGVDVSVDIFGYTATTDAPGIGQDFIEISKHVDIICAMIYPSHWGPGYFGILRPDLEPYKLVQEYMKAEQERLSKLDDPPVSRPWIQDFTAGWLGRGNYRVYGKEEVEAQIRALNEAETYEYLIWDSQNRYTRGVNYKPLN